MKKVIRLTEADLTRLVRRVIKEQTSKTPTGYGKDDPLTDRELQPDVDKIVYNMDGWVDGSNLDLISLIIGMLKNKYALDDTNPNRPIIVPALKRLAALYKMDENGDDLLQDLSSVGTKTLSPIAMKRKMQSINMLKDALKQQPTTAATKTTPVSGGTQKPSQPSGQPPTPPTGGSSRMPVR